MLRKTDCHRLLTTPRGENTTTDTLVDAICAECPTDFALSIEYIPNPNYIYAQLGSEVDGDEDTFEAYPTKSRSLDDVAIYLHSSGSTGLPKATPQTFRTLLLASEIGNLI